MICPDPGSCHVVQPGARLRLRSHIIEAGTSWYNVSRHDEVFNRSGFGDSRFSPLFAADSQPIPHACLAQNHVGALLESALKDIWGTSSRVPRSELRGRSLRRITCHENLRVVDLRDDQIHRYGIRRDHLVASPSEHYACTRRWAQQRNQVSIGGHPTTGFIWHSRQAEVAAEHASAPMRILLTVAEQAGHTAIIYDNNDTGNSVFDASIVCPDLSAGSGLAFVTELAVDLGLHVEN